MPSSAPAAWILCTLAERPRAHPTKTGRPLASFRIADTDSGHFSEAAAADGRLRVLCWNDLAGLALALEAGMTISVEVEMRAAWRPDLAGATHELHAKRIRIETQRPKAEPPRQDPPRQEPRGQRRAEERRYGANDPFRRPMTDPLEDAARTIAHEAGADWRRVLAEPAYQAKALRDALFASHPDHRGTDERVRGVLHARDAFRARARAMAA